jgi:hypothetical protein
VAVLGQAHAHVVVEQDALRGEQPPLPLTQALQHVLPDVRTLLWRAIGRGCTRHTTRVTNSWQASRR